MKTLIKILFLCVLSVLLTMAANANDRKDDRKPANDKNKNLFVVKADKNLVGAKVEILKSNGSIVAGQILTKRRLVIDFNDVKLGAYTIRIVKGDQVQEFIYTKN